MGLDSVSPLVLYAYDATYMDTGIQISAPGNNLVPVNFHPGYRAYLFTEPSPAHFNSETLLPDDDQNIRKILIGLQSADTRPGGTGFLSPISTPAIMMARRIERPVQLEPPIAFNLRVRPDVTGKAAFTFDTRILPSNGIARKPFGLTFFRTTFEDILHALYSPLTIEGILSSLDNLISDPYFNNRLQGLANLDFQIYEAEPEDYGFPIPDKQGLTQTGDSELVKTEKYRAAIRATLLPL